MNKTTLKALKDSIAHWTRLYTGRTYPSEDISARSCALCSKFVQLPACGSCPVKMKTGLSSCHGSPYMDAVRAKNMHGLRSKQFKEAALKMLEFLRDLLPAKTSQAEEELQEALTKIYNKLVEVRTLTSSKRSKLLSAEEIAEINSIYRSAQAGMDTISDIKLNHIKGKAAKGSKLKRPVPWVA